MSRKNMQRFCDHDMHGNKGLKHSCEYRFVECASGQTKTGRFLKRPATGLSPQSFFTMRKKTKSEVAPFT